MKKPLIAVLGAMTLAVSLTACGSSTDTTATDTYETPAPVVTVTEEAPSGFNSSEDEFLVDVHSVGNSVIEGNDDETILETGNLICDTLDEGNTVTEITDYLLSTGDYSTDTATEFAAAMIVSSVINLCPEYKYQLPN